MTEQNAPEEPKAPVKRKTEAQRKKEFEANRKAMDELCELYPEAFNPRKPKPLKIGIHENLAADGKLSKTRIRRALNVYVRLRSYYACMVEGADRVNVDGSPDGKVSAEDAEHAKQKLEVIDKRRAERAKQRPAKKPASKAKAKTKASPPPSKAKEARLQDKLEALVNKPKNN